MLVEWTLWCTAAKSGPACSTLFSMCLLFHECTWALKLPLASKSHVSLHVYVHLWEGESEGGRRSNSKSWGQNRFDHAGVSLMSCTSSQNIWGTITGVARREKQAPEEALFYCSSIFCGVFFFFCFTLTSLTVDHRLIMLNILLSALLDPDRRLRSFRRSERLMSILVGSTIYCTIGSCLCFVQRLFVSHSYVRNKGGSAWLKNATA